MFSVWISLYLTFQTTFSTIWNHRRPSPSHLPLRELGAELGEKGWTCRVRRVTGRTLSIGRPRSRLTRMEGAAWRGVPREGWSPLRRWRSARSTVEGETDSGVFNMGFVWGSGRNQVLRYGVCLHPGYLYATYYATYRENVHNRWHANWKDRCCKCY